MREPLLHSTWVDVDLTAISNNVEFLSTTAGTKRKNVLLMIKANAYGHDLLLVAKHAQRTGIAALGIATLNDARVLRDAGITMDIILFTEPKIEAIPLLQKYDVTVVVGSRQFLDATIAASSALPKLKMHIKINTGLNRYGFNIDEVEDVARLINVSTVKPVGIATHYSSAATDDVLTKREYQIFLRAIDIFKENGVTFPIVHASNSAATVWLKEDVTTMVRLGLAAYGLQSNIEKPLPLQSVLKWTSYISGMRMLSSGEELGYGGSWEANRASVIGVVPVGYSDGLRRGPQYQQSFLIGGKKIPRIGMSMMNHSFVDLTDLHDCRLNDEVVIIGPQAELRITPEQVALELDTSNEEVVTAIQSSIPRYSLID